MNSAKSRLIARLIHLIPILLEGEIGRDELIETLAESLEADDLASALPAKLNGLDATSMFNNDWRLLKELELLDSSGSRKYRAKPGRRLPLWVTPAEAQALEAARHALMQLGVPESSLIEGLLSRVAESIRHGEPRWSLAPSLKGISPSVWRDIQTGVSRGRMMRIHYQYPDRPAESRLLDRTRVIWMTGAFYLCAVRPDLMKEGPPEFDCVREYRLDRILALEVLDVPVTCAALPTLQVTFRLASSLAGRLSDMHDGDGRRIQAVANLPDGSLRVTIEEVSELRARQRLLMFGRSLLAVESPEWLRARILEDIQSLITRLSLDSDL